MANLFVVADDFTGALDTGVQFSKKGIPTVICIDEKFEYELMDENIEVIVIDAETRHLNPIEASKKVKKVIKKAEQYGVKHIYKKTDSTLRGNIGSELVAAMNACNSNKLFYIPSFPKAGRFTINGYHYVDDILLNNSVFSNDPLEPTRQSNIVDIIKIQSDVDVVIIREEDYERFQIIEDEQVIYVFDAQSDSNLKMIGNVLKERNKLKLLAGCAGFAEILPEIIKLKRSEIRARQYNEGYLIISGSINEITIEQINYLENQGYKSITLTPAQLVTPDYSNSDKGVKFIQDVANRINNKEPLIIKTIENRGQVVEFLRYSMGLGLDPERTYLMIAENLGAIIKKILDMTTLENLIICGGDTAYGVIKAINAKGVVPQEEVALGVVAAEVISDKQNIRIITKAGGFGKNDILAKVIDYIEKDKNEIVDVNN